MPTALATLAAAVAAVLGRRRRHARSSKPARAVIVSPRRSTVVQRDGAVRSVQTARLTVPAEAMSGLWKPANLENLARTYWRFLSRATLGLIRVVYDADTRSVVLVRRPLTLLRFDAPEYTLQRDHGVVTWRIRDGLLVARAGRGSGFLSLDVQRTPRNSGAADAHTAPDAPAEILIEVEVANFYPAIAAGIGVPVYEMTQSVLHVLVTHAFLRSLAGLELATSKVGVLRREPG